MLTPTPLTLTPMMRLSRPARSRLRDAILGRHRAQRRRRRRRERDIRSDDSVVGFRDRMLGDVAAAMATTGDGRVGFQ